MPNNRCTLWGRGHRPHYIPAIRSVNTAHRAANVVETGDNLLLLDDGDQAVWYRNHAVSALLELLGPHRAVSVSNDYPLLRIGNACFSILLATEDWQECEPANRRRLA